jgi:antitoxin component YwqK of YwqJK toxin-antitoxin module
MGEIMKKAFMLMIILIVGYSSLCFARTVSEHYPDGKIKSVQVYYKNGLIEGPYRIYWPNGKLKSKTFYKYGRPYLTKKWSEKGKELKDK